MKIYISASQRVEAQALASHIELKGHIIVSSWINESTGLFTDEELKRTFQDIDKCHVFIVMDDGNTSGKYVEFGYAMAKHKDLIVFGKPLARAHKLAHRCDNLKELFKVLKQLDKPASKVHTTGGGDLC